MDRRSRTREKPPLSHGRDISNNAQTVQSQGVLTKSQKRSLSRSRVMRWANSSAANLSTDGGADANPGDEQPSNKMFLSKHILSAKNRFKGSKAEPNLGSSPSSVSTNAAQPTPTGSTRSNGSNGIKTNGTAPGLSPTFSADDSESIILDNSNEPLSGSSQQAADPAASTSLALTSMRQQQQQQQSRPVGAFGSQPPPIPAKVKEGFFVLEPPPPIASYSSDIRQVQQPPGRPIPMKPVTQNVDINQQPGKVVILEPPPPVRSAVDARSPPRKSLPPKHTSPTPGTASGLSLGGAAMVALKLKNLRRTSSKRSSASSASSGPTSRVNSAPKQHQQHQQQQQQSTVQKPKDSTSPTSTHSSGNANIPPPPPPIHPHHISQTSNWEDQQQQQKQQYPQYQHIQAHSVQQHFSQDPQQQFVQDPYHYTSSVEAELDSVRQQCTAHVALLHQRDAQIVSLSETVERLRERMQDQLQQQLESEQHHSFSRDNSGGLYGAASVSLPDSQVRSRWMGLRWQIQQCVETSVEAAVNIFSNSTNSLDVSGGASVGRAVSPTRAAQLRRLSPNYATLLQSRTGAVCLIEAAMWTVLAQHVFGDARRSSPMCWAPPPWKSLTKINDNLLCTRPADAAFHQWRAQTATFVANTLAQDKNGAPSPYVDEVVRQLEMEVGALLAVASGGDERKSRRTDSESLRRQLFDIVGNAVALDADLCQQRARFYVHFPQSGSGKRYGMPFDPSEMAVVEQEEVMAGGDSHMHNSVSLVVRPALFKAGNSRGEAYDDVEPIERSIVCRGPARSRSSRSSPQPLSRR